MENKQINVGNVFWKDGKAYLTLQISREPFYKGKKHVLDMEDVGKLLNTLERRVKQEKGINAKDLEEIKGDKNMLNQFPKDNRGERVSYRNNWISELVNKLLEDSHELKNEKGVSQ